MILYEDTALVVLDKPAGLSSEDGVPAALRKLWDRPDAYVGVIHRLDTGVSGLMVYAKTPQAAAALSRQVTQSQQVYAEQDGRAEPDAGTPDAPPFVKQYRALIAGGPDEKLPAEGVLRDYLFKDSRKGRVFPVSRPRKGVKEAVHSEGFIGLFKGGFKACAVGVSAALIFSYIAALITKPKLKS